MTFPKYIAQLLAGKNKSKKIKKKSVVKKKSIVKTKNIKNSKRVDKYALVLFTSKTLDIPEGESVYLYAKCTGSESEPNGFYFKWLQYSKKELYLDPTVYDEEIWKIVWLNKQLSPSELKVLDKHGFISKIIGNL